MRRLILMAALALAGATTTAPAQARQAPQAAITVNDPAGARTVTEADIAHWTEIARRSSGQTRPAPITRQLRAQVLQLLVSFEWIAGEARAQGLSVSDQEVEASFREQRQQSFPKDADFQRFLRQSKQTLDDILGRVRLDLLSSKIRDKVVAPAEATVTETAVDQFLAENGPITVPERRDVRFIVTKTRAAADAARAELRRGATWKEVARRHAVGRRANLLTRQARDYMEPRLDRAVFRARRGRLIGPIKSDHAGYYVAEVVRIRPERPLPAATQREQVRVTLLSEAQHEALDTFVTGFTATWKSRTVCAPRYDWFSDCSNWDGTELMERGTAKVQG